MMSLRHQLSPQRLAAVLMPQASNRASHQGNTRARPAKSIQASNHVSSAGRGHARENHLLTMSFYVYLPSMFA